MNALTAYALTKVGLGYGSRLPGGNGLSQRGPNTYDCVGLVRECVKVKAPQFFPPTWGGEDPWTVEDLHSSYTAHGLPIVSGIAPFPGDGLIFGNDQHIAIAIDAASCVSALNVAKGVCVTRIAEMNPPLAYVIRFGLELPPMDFVPASPLATCDLTGGSPYADLMSTQSVPAGVYPGHATGVPFLGYQTRPSVGTAYPPIKMAWVILPTFGLAVIGATCVSNVVLPSGGDHDAGMAEGRAAYKAELIAKLPQ